MKQGPQEEPVTYHRPEFVILEDEKKEDSFEQKKQDQYQAAFKQLKTVDTSLPVRLVALIGCCVSVILAFFSLCFFALNLLIAALTMFKNKSINEAAKKSWKSCKKVFTFCAGLGLAVFSPFLGFGLIVLYFVLNDEPIDSRLFKMSKMNQR